DPAAREEIDAIGRTLDEARALNSAGRHKPALALAEKAADAAERVKYWPSRSESLLVKGFALAGLGDSKGAERILQQVVTAADAAGAELDKVRALAMLIYVEGCQLGASAEGRFLAEAAQPLLANLGNGPAEVDLYMRTGSMLHCQGRPEEALRA